MRELQAQGDGGDEDFYGILLKLSHYLFFDQRWHFTNHGNRTVGGEGKGRIRNRVGHPVGTDRGGRATYHIHVFQDSKHYRQKDFDVWVVFHPAEISKACAR